MGVIQHKELNDLSIELIKKSLKEFTGWHTEWDAINPGGQYVIYGNLSTNEGHEFGRANVEYFGCKFHLKVDKGAANWYFEMKCDSEMYTLNKNDGTTESGGNWSGCIIPSLWKPLDLRQEYKDKMEQTIYNCI